MTDILTKVKQALAKVVGEPGSAGIEILMRDKTGECEGECRDRVREGEVDRQKEINLSGVEEIDSYPTAKWGFTRNEPPGVYGGHM